MARCPHGFEPAAVKCPMGCHGLTEPAEPTEIEHASQAALVTRTRAITNQQIIEALKERGSLNGAAIALGINPGTVVNRAKSDPAVRQALSERHTPRQRRGGREKTYSDDELRMALASSSSIRETCRRLGVTYASIYLRCKAVPELWELYVEAKAVSGAKGNRHPGLRDMTGRRFGVLVVVRRAQNQANGNAAWWCRCDGCGGEGVYQGIALRARVHAPEWCRACRPANPGTVTRRAHG